MGLLTDGWFYISSAGLFGSGILFFFLLDQYRVASEAADVTEGEQGVDKDGSVSAAIRPVYIPDEPPLVEIVSHPVREPEMKPKVEIKAEHSGPDQRKDATNATGGISPAVVYLQNIKVELTDLHRDLRSLAKRVDDELSAVSTRDKTLIDRLCELTRAVESMKAAAPAPERTPDPTPAPEPAKIVVEAPPSPALDAIAQPKPEPAPSADETIRMELGAIIAVPPASQAPEKPDTTGQVPAQAGSADANPAPPPEKKTRRGPVWPV
ncbi:MAG: hypothetical protein AAB268_05420 [Elusimicrobiota bacterium]